MEADVAAKIQKEASDNMRLEAPGASEIFKDTGFKKKTQSDNLPAESNPFATPPPSRSDRESTYAPSTHAPSTQPSNAFTYLERRIHDTQVHNTFLPMDAIHVCTVTPPLCGLHTIISRPFPRPASSA